MNTLTVILKLFPIILSAVKAVEDAIPLPGQGQKKLDLILNVVKQAYDASADLTQSFSWDKLAAIVVPMISNIVDLHNQLGLFSKPTQPVPSQTQSA
jgi:hypothetical protein